MRGGMGLSSELDILVIHTVWPETGFERTEIVTETEFCHGDANGDSIKKFFVGTNPHEQPVYRHREKNF